MIHIYSDIDRIEAAAWRALEVSETANWFQTREAYAFYSAVPGEMRPFCFAAEEDVILSIAAIFRLFATISD